MTTTAHHRVLIVGGGAGGISVASRMIKKGYTDVAIIEPSDKHHYQPLWTLVGGGHVTREITERDEASVMPKKATWIKDAASGFDPDNKAVSTASGKTYGYDALIVCPGIQLDWDRTPGLKEGVGKNGLSSNYTYDLAPKTWEFIQNTKSGTAVFTMPSDPIKCAGAPQKIAYLACDYWRKEGVLDNIDVHLILPTPGMFGVKVFSDVLAEVAADYGIKVHFQSELASVDGAAKVATIKSLNNPNDTFEIKYDLMHAVPHQSAPDWVKSSPLSTGDATGYVDIDKNTMQHVRYPDVFSLGDAGSSPNSKTGAAVRKQAPVVAANVDKVLSGEPLDASYGGYASCPLTTSGNKMLLAEFDYTMEHTPSFPLINLTKPRTDMWYVKKNGLPFLYWNFLLKGRA